MPIPAAYRPLVDAARPRAQLWRLALGVVLTLAVYLLWMIALGALIGLLRGAGGLERALVNVSIAADPWSVIGLMGTFLGVWLGLALSLRLLHRRRLGSLMGRAPRVLRDFVRGAGVMLAVGGVLTLLCVPFWPPLALAPEPARWAAFVPLALAGIALQTGAEELFFRGYLQSQLAARFGRPPVYLLVPSVLFGLAHYSPGELGANLWIVVASTGLFGLIAADVTQRSGSLGMAWGLHFANNVLALLIVSLSGGLSGLALLEPAGGALAPEALRPLLILDMAVMIGVWLACRLLIRAR